MLSITSHYKKDTKARMRHHYLLIKTAEKAVMELWESVTLLRRKEWNPNLSGSQAIPGAAIGQLWRLDKIA